MNINNPNHKNQISRLNRIEGQVKGIKKMIEESRYCIDILTQTKAVRVAIRKVEQDILNGHIRHCIAAAVESGSVEEIKKKIDEIMTILDRQH